ncbi:hypothetical protein QRX60_30535 [Amycolatopsis mongoliensis]|uniref:Uncharacterized protein n=1 Tax=Amycolatopsis mongoliensis TaxID=715475 RepID=A0A9Y2NE72_9PSEU|nr:hypothetical protein [Amycolatopsis sp. 4-36]WIX98393.1 hypothetical protein QRX60_30535 [Amycolatopsis sp. 4-36]
MIDLACTLMLITGFVVLAVVLRAAERWCETHPHRSGAARPGQPRPRCSE